MGITGRNDIGFLLWDQDEKLTEEAGLGSRLKTPVLPIWITCVNGSWGVLFNPNKDLMKSYAAENRSHSAKPSPVLQLLARFNLYYYSNTPIKEKIDTILLIDTRNNRNFGKHTIELNDDFDGVEENPLEKAIQSKLV